MAEILSQDEINALVAAMAREKSHEQKSPGKSQGPSSEPVTIRPYDFSRPNKLSKDQLRTLHIMHEVFARGIATSLSAYLRTYVEAEVVSTDSVAYVEFSQTLANPGIMAIFTLSPLEGRSLLAVDPEIGFAIMDRLLGGPGQPPRQLRELTEIEQPVMQRIVERLMENLPDSWSHMAPIEPRFERLELNPQFTQLVPPKDMVVTISVEIAIRNTSGKITICIPFEVIEPLVPKLSAHYLFTSDRHDTTPEQAEALKTRVRQLQVPLRVLLGSAEVKMQEILELKEGDFIPLDTRADGTLPVLIGGRLKFSARPGRSRNRMAIEIVDHVQDEEEEETNE